MSADDGSAPGAASRPNVLFASCDQLRADHLGIAGNSVVQAPNIDALAARATVFDRAHVNNPVCIPRRSTIMTGRMPSAHGVVFQRPLPAEFFEEHCEMGLRAVCWPRRVTLRRSRWAATVVRWMLNSAAS